MGFAAHLFLISIIHFNGLILTAFYFSLLTVVYQIELDCRRVIAQMPMHIARPTPDMRHSLFAQLQLPVPRIPQRIFQSKS